MLRDLTEDPVAALARLVDVPGLQGEAKPFGGRVRFMNGKVAPPDSTIIPQMMIGIIMIDSESELRFALHEQVFGVFTASSAPRS